MINDNRNIKKISGSEKNTTNNRMALMEKINDRTTMTRKTEVEIYKD